MSVHRVMGIETEFGVFAPDDPEADPTLLSQQVVAGYRAASAAAGQPLDTRWDYHGEDPLRDARGYDVPRHIARPEQLTHEISDAVPNVVLANGGRLYVDHAHPEYSSPEFTTPLAGVRFDRAGELLAQRTMVHIAAAGDAPVPLLYKNNSDGKGASYGTHENFLVDRSVPFESLAAALMPFLVTRQVMCGAGQVGIGPTSSEAGFQISQRADHMERLIGLDTTARRPIINTRDEPHSDSRKYRRLHLIIGDANTFEYSTYLKLGSTAAVLHLVEALHFAPDPQLQQRLDALELVDPVAEVRNVSRDLDLKHGLSLRDGRVLTALEIQQEYLDLATLVATTDDQTQELLKRWRATLAALATDPLQVADKVEWVGKLRLLRGMIARHDLDWGHPRIAAANIHWADLRPTGLAQRLRAAGLARVLITDDAANRAINEPPSDTRAWFRGSAVAKFGADVAAAGWGTIILRAGENLHRIPMEEPQRGTQELTQEIIAASNSSAELVERLTAGK